MATYYDELTYVCIEKLGKVYLDAEQGVLSQTAKTNFQPVNILEFSAQGALVLNEPQFDFLRNASYHLDSVLKLKGPLQLTLVAIRKTHAYLEVDKANVELIGYQPADLPVADGPLVLKWPMKLMDNLGISFSNRKAAIHCVVDISQVDYDVLVHNVKNRAYLPNPHFILSMTRYKNPLLLSSQKYEELSKNQQLATPYQYGEEARSAVTRFVPSELPAGLDFIVEPARPHSMNLRAFRRNEEGSNQVIVQSRGLIENEMEWLPHMVQYAQNVQQLTPYPAKQKLTPNNLAVLEAKALQSFFGTTAITESYTRLAQELEVYYTPLDDFIKDTSALHNNPREMTLYRVNNVYELALIGTRKQQEPATLDVVHLFRLFERQVDFPLRLECHHNTRFEHYRELEDIDTVNFNNGSKQLCSAILKRLKRIQEAHPELQVYVMRCH